MPSSKNSKPSSEWVDDNPVLPSGVVGFEEDTSRYKYGDGETEWNDLPYPDETQDFIYTLANGATVDQGTAAPTTETWMRGSVRYNSEPSAAGVSGWMCVAAGTPGTWKAMSNLAS